MRKSLLLFTLIISMFTINTFAQKTGIIKVNTSYTGVLDGYDHINKTMVYVDGMLAGETSEQLQSIPNSCAITTSKGKHSIRIINMANYEGNWEEHTIANEYSIDALYESEIKLKKEITINLVFDITEEKTIARVN
jgi:hypothetical protein